MICAPQELVGRHAVPPELAGAAQLRVAVSVNSSCCRDTTFAFNLTTSLIQYDRSTTKGVGRGTTLAWPGWKQKEI
jgi:hypothetical protein